MPNYPVIALLLGSPAALGGAEGAATPLWIALDLAVERDLAILRALGDRFEIRLVVRDREPGESVAVERRLVAPLGANVASVLAAAAEYLKSIPSPQRSFARGLAAFEAPAHDRLGTGQARAGQVDEAALTALATPAEAMRACALVRRLSQPHAEDWLVMTRGYSIDLWQAQRRRVIERAVELGIWPGPVAAQIAVNDGLASSRKELAVLLQRNFTTLTGGERGGARRRGAPAAGHGLDDAAVRDNWRALKAEARALGLPVVEWALPRSQPIASDSDPVASGSIGPRRDRPAPASGDAGGRGPANGQRDLPGGRALAGASDAELLAALGDRTRRLAAATELCRRGAPSAVEPVFAALELMSRVEAGHVLGSIIGFGRAAEPTLLAGLANRKAFLRQGAALALAVMKSEAGVEAVCDLLLDEPTEIWREVARALGETGAAAVMPLAARLAQRPQRARERVAWALAHIAARNTRRPIETLAAGRDATAAAVARRALELVEEGDDLEPPDDEPTHDQTFNRTFSRRFFESVRTERAAAASQGAGDPSPARSGPVGSAATVSVEMGSVEMGSVEMGSVEMGGVEMGGVEMGGVATGAEAGIATAGPAGEPTSHGGTDPGNRAAGNRATGSGGDGARAGTGAGSPTDTASATGTVATSNDAADPTGDIATGSGDGSRASEGDGSPSDAASAASDGGSGPGGDAASAGGAAGATSPDGAPGGEAGLRRDETDVGGGAGADEGRREAAEAAAPRNERELAPN
jgi:HEAT repeat protein